MPSPFPGMDPYLEDPALWPDVHTALINGIRHSLVPQVRPKYAVRVEQRVYLSDAEDPAYRTIVPDLRIVRGKTVTSMPPRTPGAVTQPVEIVEAPELESKEYRVELIDRADKSIVTVIELLSPANKIRTSEARRSFLTKRREILASASHWIEIDLLRAGLRTVQPLAVPHSDYLIYLNRHEANGRRKFVWPFQLREPMPIIAVPLRSPDGDVPLNLQAVLASVYDGAGYDLDIDYKQNPVATLNADDLAWTESLLKSASLR